MNPIPLRPWTFSSSQYRLSFLLSSLACRRAAPKRLDTKFFSTLVTTRPPWQAQRVHAFFSSAASETRSRDVSLLFGAAESFRHRVLEFQQSRPWSRVGWYRSPKREPFPSSRVRNIIAPRRRSSYHPQPSGPLEQLRRLFNKLPSELVIWGILGLNGAVYLAWQYAADQARNGNTSMYVKMYRNILLSWRNIREGRIWTIITSTFSHSTASHIFLNGLTFYFMAPPIINLLGNSAFMGLYLFGGISCSVLSLLLNQSLVKREGSSNGASGAIFAVMSFFACVAPQTKFLVFFVVPVPAWAVITGLFVWDGLSALSDRRTTIDGAGHVGGIMAGVAYYFLKRRMIF